MVIGYKMGISRYIRILGVVEGEGGWGGGAFGEVLNFSIVRVRLLSLSTICSTDDS